MLSDRNRLVQLLDAQPPVSLSHQPPSVVDPFRIRIVTAGTSASEELLTFLSNETDLSIFDDTIQFLGAGTGIRTTLRDLAGWLVITSQDFDSDFAVSSLERYLKEEYFDRDYLFAIDRLKVPNEERFEIGPGIFVESFERAPESWGKQFFTPDHSLPRKPTATALVRLSLPVRKGKLPLPETAEVQSAIDDVGLAISILGLVLKEPPRILGSWSHPARWVPAIGSSGVNHVPALETIVTGQNLSIDSAAESSGLFEDFKALDKQLVPRLNVALERLSFAKTRRHLVDSAIDLGIAIESVFLDENDKDELTSKVSLRAGRFLGSDLSSRISIARVFRALYAVRSEAVHRGTIQVQLKKSTRKGLPNDLWQTYRLLEEGYGLLTEALKFILRNRAWPDWEVVAFS